MIQEINVDALWNRNKNRPWVQSLEKSYKSGYGKDFETIAFWVTQFNSGVMSTLVTDRQRTITNGHHRLIAARICKLETIVINVCPQKSSYGR